MPPKLISSAWVKAELKAVLASGVAIANGDDHTAQSQPLPRPGPRTKTAMKRRVQCIEVDEKLNALKINDGETVVWCFVATPAMKKVSYYTSLL